MTLTEALDALIADSDNCSTDEMGWYCYPALPPAVVIALARVARSVAVDIRPPVGIAAALRSLAEAMGAEP